MKRILSLLLVLAILLSASAALAGDPVAVQAITLDMTEASVAAGRRITLKAAVEPANASNKQIVWTSSDESVATVRYGQVAGVGRGTATITATAADGSGVTATATVTVLAPVTKIIPEQSHITLPPDTGWDIYWTVEPANADNKDVIWTSNNQQIATVENGVIYTHRNGYCTITGIAADGGGARVNVNLTVKHHDILILEPGEVDVDFETENTTLTEERVVKGNTTTVKINRFFVTENGCVTSPEDMVLVPVKAGSDVISIQFIEKKKTARIDKYSVFVARNAVGEAAVYTEDGKVRPIRFLNLPWGSSYPEVKEEMSRRGRTVKTIAQYNDDLRSMMDGSFPFGNLTAGAAAANYTYDHNSRMYEVKNSLFRGDLYFDPAIPLEDVARTVKRVYTLEGGQESADYCEWERDHVKVTLSKTEYYTKVEVIWDGTPIPEEEEEPEETTEETTETAGGEEEDDWDDPDWGED